MMKIKTSILLTAIMLSSVGLTFYACKSGSTPAGEESGEKEISHYTCPMHPQIHEDHEGDCPICHMRLVPVYKEGATPSSKGPTTGPAVNISTERQQTIGITTATVQKKPVTKIIRTVGEVAYDPELATAQREFVEVVRNVPSLKKEATNRLKILGMSDEEIRELADKKKTDSSLYLPAKEGPIWVHAPIYRHEIPLVAVGQKATLTLASTKNKFEGVVRGIEPVLSNTTRSARVRIELASASADIRPGAFLDAQIEVPLGEKIAVPKSAVIDTGTRQLVFVVHEENHFQSREIGLGAQTEDEWIVESGLEEGEVIATSSVFMIDSESQLKAAVAGGGTHEH